MSRHKNRPTKKPGPSLPSSTHDAGAAVTAVEENPFASLTYHFADVSFDEQYQVDEKQLRLLIRDWRKGRATRTFWQALTDGYVAVFSFAVIAAMLVGGITAAQRSAAGCTAVGCTTARGLLPWLVLLGLMTATLALTRLFGPVVASAAEGFWLLEAPLSRAKLLSNRLWAVVGIAAAAGAVGGALVTLLTGLSGLTVVLWTLATGLAAAALTAFAAAEQGAERTRLVGVIQSIVAGLAVIVMLAVVATAAGWVSVQIGDDAFAQQMGVVVIGVSVIVLVLSCWLAARRLNNIRRARLVSGGDLMSGLQGAGFALDFALMRDILTERRYLAKGQVRPTRGHWVGTKSLVWRDLQRLWRNPRPLMVLVISLVVPYALSSLGVGALTGTLAGLVLLIAIVPFFDSLRVISRTRGLARCFPFGTVDLRQAASVVPAIMAALWAVVASPAFVMASGKPLAQSATNGVLTSLCVGAAGYLGAMRWVSARPPDYNGPMMSTASGAMPPGLMFNMVRGIDIVAVVTFPLIFNWTPWISVVIAFIAWTLLRQGGMNQQEMLEASEEQKKELAAMRAGRSAAPKEKVVIQRSAAPVRKRPPLK